VDAALVQQHAGIARQPAATAHAVIHPAVMIAAVIHQKVAAIANAGFTLAQHL